MCWQEKNAGLIVLGSFKASGWLQANACAFVAFSPYGYGSTVVGPYVRISNCTGDSPALGTDSPAAAAFRSFDPNSFIGGDFQL
jgi:hypothetical protein